MELELCPAYLLHIVETVLWHIVKQHQEHRTRPFNFHQYLYPFQIRKSFLIPQNTVQPSPRICLRNREPGSSDGGVNADHLQIILNGQAC